MDQKLFRSEVFPGCIYHLFFASSSPTNFDTTTFIHTSICELNGNGVNPVTTALTRDSKMVSQRYPEHKGIVTKKNLFSSEI